MARHVLGILGRKAGMTQVYVDGRRVGVTVIEAGPCRVLQVKAKTAAELVDTPKRPERIHVQTGKPEPRPAPRGDGYYAVQLGFAPKLRKRTSKPAEGHALKAAPEAEQKDDKAPVGRRFIREFRLDAKPELKIGDNVDLKVLDGNVYVDVTGITKGKGFQGGMKRWHMKGFRQSHGTSKVHRRVGAIGRNLSINKGVPKGKHMPGHMGVDQVTVKGLRVIEIDAAKNLLLVEGAVPGGANGYLMIRPSDRVKNNRKKKA
ncbi:MAG TPA: 50S ribosomal protein L3 [Planctomycetota bacterium]|nr:50S ribosomal protein L3 [Planctomycetota bacterium]